MEVESCGIMLQNRMRYFCASKSTNFLLLFLYILILPISFADEELSNPDINSYLQSPYGNLRPYLHIEREWKPFTGGFNLIGGDLPGVGLNLEYGITNRLFMDVEINRKGEFFRIGAHLETDDFIVNGYLPLSKRRFVIDKTPFFVRTAGVASGVDFRYKLDWLHVGYQYHSDGDTGWVASIEQKRNFQLEVKTLNGNDWSIAFHTAFPFNRERVVANSLPGREHIVRFEEEITRLRISDVAPVSPETVTTTVTVSGPGDMQDTPSPTPVVPVSPETVTVTITVTVSGPEIPITVTVSGPGDMPDTPSPMPTMDVEPDPLEIFRYANHVCRDNVGARGDGCDVSPRFIDRSSFTCNRNFGPNSFDERLLSHHTCFFNSNVRRISTIEPTLEPFNLFEVRVDESSTVIISIAVLRNNSVPRDLFIGEKLIETLSENNLDVRVYEGKFIRFNPDFMTGGTVTNDLCRIKQDEVRVTILVKNSGRTRRHPFRIYFQNSGYSILEKNRFQPGIRAETLGFRDC